MKTLYHDVNEALQREITVLPSQIRLHVEITMARSDLFWTKLIRSTNQDNHLMGPS